MPTVSLLKPNTAGAAIIATNSTAQSTIASAQAGSTVKMFMKLQSANIVTGTTVAQTTGDGDAFEHYEHNAMLRGQASLTGFVVASNTIGIAELKGANNPVSVALFTGIGTGSANRYLLFKMMIQQMNIQYMRTAPFVGISVSGPMTDTYMTAGTTLLNTIVEHTDAVVDT